MTKYEPIQWRDRRSAAAHLCVTPWMIDLWKRQGRLIPRYVNSKPLYRTEDLDKIPLPKPEAP